MKKLIFALLLVIGVGVGGPFFAGQKAEMALDQWVDYLNDSGSYVVSWDRYNKSLFSTDAVLLVKLKEPLDIPGSVGLGADWVLPLHITVNHGPLLIHDHFRQGWFSGELLLSDEHEGWIKEHIKVDGEGPFFVSNIYMDLKGDIHINDHSLPFSLSDEGGIISVDSYIGSGLVSLDQSIDYSGMLASVKFEDKAEYILAEGIDFKVSSDLSQQYGEYLVPGEGSFSIESITSTMADNMGFTLQDAQMTSVMSFNPSDKDANISFKMGFKKLQAMGEELTDAEFEVIFDRLGLSFLDQYISLMQEFGSLGAENTSLMASKMSNLLATDLLPFGPKISIPKLTFSSAEGRLDFAGDIEVSPDAASKVADPFSMIGDVTVNAATEVDKALALKLAKKSTLQGIEAELLATGQTMSDAETEQMADQRTAMTLSMLVIQGMLIDNGEKYTSSFQFKDGAAVLNGQPVPLPF